MVATGQNVIDLSQDVTPADISVVVCAYTPTRWDDIVRAVESIAAQIEPVREIVLVIDHNDVLLARARAKFRHISVISSTGRPGLSGARDTGVSHCSGSVVAFLDDDAYAAPDWSRELAQAYADAAVLGAGGWVEPDWTGGRPKWWPTEFDWVVGCSYTGLPTSRSEVRNVIGANMSLRREVLGAIGGFDHRLGRVGATYSGGEETEIYIRAKQAFPLAKVILEPRARVKHKVPASRATAAYFVRRCWGEGGMKAQLSGIAGRQQALASEREYTRRTLPRGVTSDLAAGRPVRASAVVLGLGITVAAYFRTTIRNARFH